MFTKDMKAISLRYMNLLNVNPPFDIYAAFIGSFLVLQSSEDYFCNKATPNIKAKYIMIDLSNDYPSANYMDREQTIMSQLCYGKPNATGDIIKRYIARTLQIQHFFYCKLQNLNGTLCRLYFGPSYFEEEWYLYIDVLYNVDADEATIITSKKMLNAFALGLSTATLHNIRKTPSRLT